MSGLKVVFMGTPDFAVPALERLLASRHRVVGVVTQPDKPRGRGLKLIPPPVKQIALQHGISPILQPEKLKNPDFINQLKELSADIFVVVAFRILPEAVFTLPPLGTINIHPSLLPKYRGAAPLHWTIINGEKITGVTIIRIQREVDAGNILLQREVPVLPDETVGSLHDRLAKIGAEMLLETLDRLEKGGLQPVPQRDEEATPAPKITKEMCHLSFNQPAEKVKNWIHGLSPFPGAYAFYQDKMVKLYRARVEDPGYRGQPPGTIVEARGNRLWVACNPGLLGILELQLAGKKRLRVEELLRGFSFRVGDRLQ